MGWGKYGGKLENAPIVDRKRKNELEQKREKRGSCSNCAQEAERRVGGEVIKQRKMLQVRSGSEKASWGKSSGKGKTPQ